MTCKQTFTMPISLNKIGKYTVNNQLSIGQTQDSDGNQIKYTKKLHKSCPNEF